MKIYSGRVRLRSDGDGKFASHFIEVDDEATGRVRFRFKRPIHNFLKTPPIPRMQPATFRQQLLSMNRAYAVTCAEEKDYPAFIEVMLKDAYGDEADIVIKELDCGDEDE